MLEYTPRVWAWRPLPPGVDLETSLGVGLETPLDTCKASWDTTPSPLGDLQGMLGYHHPHLVNRITDTYKNITLPKLRCGQ